MALGYPPRWLSVLRRLGEYPTQYLCSTESMQDAGIGILRAARVARSPPWDYAMKLHQISKKQRLLPGTVQL